MSKGQVYDIYRWAVAKRDQTIVAKGEPDKKISESELNTDAVVRQRTSERQPPEDGPGVKINHTNGTLAIGVIKSADLTFVVITEKSYPEPDMIKFLAYFRKKFVDTCGKNLIEAAGEQDKSLSKKYKEPMKQMMALWSTPYAASTSAQVQELQGKLIVEGQELLSQQMQRQELIEDNYELSADIAESSSNFRDGAKTAKNKAWWANVKIYLVGLLVLAVCIIILLAVLGVFNKDDDK